MSEKTVLRVGVYNNFNYTDVELSKVAEFEQQGYLPFLNSNSLVSIKSDYPSIVTINPYLDFWHPPTGDIANVKACRVKWVEGANDKVHRAQMEAIDWCLQHSIPVLLTYMRFGSKLSMSQYVSEAGIHNYTFVKSYYRLSCDQCWAVHQLIGAYAAANGYSKQLIYSCDLKGGGCPDCGNCIRLTYGDQYSDIAALSLSCSGDAGSCIFHCPDCWAKRLGKITNFKLDEVTKNNKQKGNTKHD